MVAECTKVKPFTRVFRSGSGGPANWAGFCKNNAQSPIDLCSVTTFTPNTGKSLSFLAVSSCPSGVPPRRSPGVDAELSVALQFSTKHCKIVPSKQAYGTQQTFTLTTSGKVELDFTGKGVALEDPGSLVSTLASFQTCLYLKCRFTACRLHFAYQSYQESKEYCSSSRHVILLFAMLQAYKNSRQATDVTGVYDLVQAHFHWFVVHVVALYSNGRYACCIKWVLQKSCPVRGCCKSLVLDRIVILPFFMMQGS